MSSSTLFTLYYLHIEINNNLPEKITIKPIDSFQLSYAGAVEVGSSVSLAADKELAITSQCIYNKMPAFKKVSKPYGKDKSKQIEETNPSSSKNISNNMFNMQLLYNINQAINLESWDSNFNPILLYVL